MKRIIQYTLFVSLLFFVSCGEDEFGTKKNSSTTTTIDLKTESQKLCSNSTLVKPPVDFLFVWDNSSSQFSVNQATKSALNNTIDLISDRFDYNILLAPLIPYTGSELYFVSSTPKSPSSTTSEPIVVSSRENAAHRLGSFSPAGSGAEAGMQRVINLLKTNVSNQVFRKNAYTMVVIMSNEDDDSWVGDSNPPDTKKIAPFINEKFQDLMCIRGNYSGNSSSRCSGFPKLNSLMMRFFSIVPHKNKCQSGYRQSYVYKGVSEKVYLASYTNGNGEATGGTEPFDSIDVCNGMDQRIFDSINNSIVDKVIKHKYNYWPVTQNPNALFNENTIKVKKNTGEEYFATEDTNSDGFKYVGNATVNTRYEPTAGEPFTGHVIQLFGKARVQYPECLIVTTTTPTDYYGYVHMPTKPLESSIKLTINGKSIPKSSTNGWQLLKSSGSPQYIENKNIKIKGPADYTPATPADNKTGYFLQVFGDAVYSNGAVVDVLYDPSS